MPYMHGTNVSIIESTNALLRDRADIINPRPRGETIPKAIFKKIRKIFNK